MVAGDLGVIEDDVVVSAPTKTDLGLVEGQFVLASRGSPNLKNPEK
jgi:hypothetical protein